MIPKEKLVLALDVTDRGRLRALVAALAPHVGMFKIGPVAFAAHGPDLVREVVKTAPVFLDLKLHDIPNTVAAAVRQASALRVSLMTIHAAGGAAMIAAAADAAKKSGLERPLVVAVTVLTHIEPPDLQATGVARPLAEQVSGLARLAMGAGADGVVCSPLEVARLRQELGPKAILVVPGLRPAGEAAGDQRRTDTPAAALAAGADYLVIGRPIVEATDPVLAAERIRREG